jgi:membrane-associated phospholipid phosphatase
VPRNVRAPLAGCLICVGGLGLLALLVYGSGSVQSLDRAVRDRLIADPGSGAESLASAVAHLGDPLVMLALVALAFGIGWKRGRRREAVAALAVVAGANLTTQLLKVLVSHPRVRSILGAEGFAWDGFPSGHTTSVASLAIAFAFVLPARFRPFVWLLGACLTAAVGCAVVVLHRHFPSDVPGGVLVAGAWGFGVLAVLRLVRGEGPRPLAQPSSRAAISLK